jgi:hypothetical protein
MANLKVCDGGTQGKGDSFNWINEHDEDCHLSHCMPPLTQDTYTVKKKVGGVPGTTPAHVQSGAASGDYPYTADCCTQKGDPIIKIQ